MRLAFLGAEAAGESGSRTSHGGARSVRLEPDIT